MRRIISMVLCVMMLAVAVTGCAGSKPASDSGESSEIVEIVEVEIPKLAKDQILVMDAVGLAVKAHADAMIWTEKLSRAAEDDSLSEEAKMEVLDNCIEAWRIADAVSKKAESMTDLLSQAEELPEYQYTTAALIKEDSDGNLYCAIKGSLADSIDDLFSVKVYAAGNTKIDAKTWAENITKAYDEGKNGQKLKNIANMMGLNGDDKEDCKKAYKALQTAQGIMKGTYEGEQAEKEAATWDNIYKTAKVLKTSGKVAGFAAGFLSLGATTGLTGALELGGVAVDGIDATLEVMDTGAMLILGDNNSVSVKAQDLGSKLAPVSSVLSAANAGKTLIGLDWSGGLGAINKGLSDNDGYGIISYIGNSIADYLDDKKLVGGAIKKGNDGSFKCNLVQIYSNAKPEEKEKIKEQLKEAGFKDEAITEILKPASAATDESTLISFEELTPEQIDEISIMTDVISEENNPEKTVDELAKEMKDIIRDTYNIVAGGDVERFKGIYEGSYVTHFHDGSDQIYTYPHAVFVVDGIPFYQRLSNSEEKSKEIISSLNPEDLYDDYYEIHYDNETNTGYGEYISFAEERVVEEWTFTESEDGSIRLNFTMNSYLTEDETYGKAGELYMSKEGEFYKVRDSY